MPSLASPELGGITTEGFALNVVVVKPTTVRSAHHAPQDTGVSMSDCGCEQRRETLKNYAPSFCHPLIDSFDGFDFLWGVLGNIGAVVVLYLLLRGRKAL